MAFKHVKHLARGGSLWNCSSRGRDQEPFTLLALTFGGTRLEISAKKIQGPTVIGHLSSAISACDRGKEFLDCTFPSYRSRLGEQRDPIGGTFFIQAGAGV